MPAVIPPEPPHDPVTVGAHDLARLLIMFRGLLEGEPPPEWDHEVDYDLSFERLADVLEAAEGRADPRYRCREGEAPYRWPEPRTVRLVPVKAGSMTGLPPRLVHMAEYAPDAARPTVVAVCGMLFADLDVPRRWPDGYRRCPGCWRAAGRLGNVTVEPGDAVRAAGLPLGGWGRR
jgi:hypothetical protein